MVFLSKDIDQSQQALANMHTVIVVISNNNNTHHLNCHLT